MGVIHLEHGLVRIFAVGKKLDAGQLPWKVIGGSVGPLTLISSADRGELWSSSRSARPLGRAPRNEILRDGGPDCGPQTVLLLYWWI